MGAHPLGCQAPAREDHRRARRHPAGGFNPTWQRHVAAYALAEPELGPGRVLDLGCGVGHSYHLLAPRETVGVDLDAGGARGPGARDGRRRHARAAVRRRVSSRSVLSVQSLEHVPDPERVLAEVVRVLEPDGVAIFVTPNRLTLGRPDEIIDPYHYVEFDADELRGLCSRSLRARSSVRGLFGSRPLHGALRRGARRRSTGCSRLDPLRLRRAVPMTRARSGSTT